MTADGPPTGQQPSRLRRFWARRSRKGKVALVLGALFLVLLVVGIASPPPEDDPQDAASESSADTSESVSTEDSGDESTTAGTTTEAAPAPAPPPPPPRVAAVVDGDTIRMENGARVRLIQIDAPELNAECYGRKARVALRSLLPAGSEVRLVRDRRLDNRDRFGRLLRYVFKGSRNVNVVLVRRGAASVWFFEGERGRFADRLTSAADQARNLGRGAWGACDASYDFESGWMTKVKPLPPPPAPTTAPAPAANCHPSYVGACLDPFASDYDCEGGSGNGPKYTGPVRVVGPDDFGLDSDNDGYGCEDS